MKADFKKCNLPEIIKTFLILPELINLCGLYFSKAKYLNGNDFAGTGKAIFIDLALTSGGSKVKQHIQGIICGYPENVMH